MRPIACRVSRLEQTARSSLGAARRKSCGSKPNSPVQALRGAGFDRGLGGAAEPVAERGLVLGRRIRQAQLIAYRRFMQAGRVRSSAPITSRLRARMVVIFDHVTFKHHSIAHVQTCFDRSGPGTRSASDLSRRARPWSGQPASAGRRSSGPLPPSPATAGDRRRTPTQENSKLHRTKSPEALA